VGGLLLLTCHFMKYAMRISLQSMLNIIFHSKHTNEKQFVFITASDCKKDNIFRFGPFCLAEKAVEI